MGNTMGTQIKNADIVSMHKALESMQGAKAARLVDRSFLGADESPLEFAASKLINELVEVFRPGGSARPLTASPFGKHVSQIMEIYIMIRDHVHTHSPEALVSIPDIINTLIDRKLGHNADLAHVVPQVKEFFASLEVPGHYARVGNGWELRLPEFYLDSEAHLKHTDDAHPANSFTLSEDGSVSIVGEAQHAIE